jgi:serine/threonine protein kinase
VEKKTGTSSSQKTGAQSSSKKTEGIRTFSNSCLDNPFVAPEALFLKYLNQSSALDVWSFGMIMYCLLFGRKPESFYSAYRHWYKKCHGHDIEMADSQMPFIPPNQNNFIYDPFAFDFENPFNSNQEFDGELADIAGSLKDQGGKLSFENFIKSLEGMSYSALFTQENSKKFFFPNIQEEIEKLPDKERPKFPG